MTEEENVPCLTIADLKRLAKDGEPHHAVVHAQVEKVTSKTTKSGNPFLDWTLRDADDSFSVKVWDNHPNFALAGAWGPGLLSPSSDTGLSANTASNPRTGIFESSEWKRSRACSPQEGASPLARRKTTPTSKHRWQHSGTRGCGRSLQPFLQDLRRTVPQDGSSTRLPPCAPGRTGRARGADDALCQRALRRLHRGQSGTSSSPGCSFHDCGKLWENCAAREGFCHALLGNRRAHRAHPHGDGAGEQALARGGGGRPARTGPPADPSAGETRIHLLHLIAAHHGEHAFGSPTVPKTPEAQLLHYVDNIDAKMEMFRGGYLKARELGPGVFERVRPLPGNLVASSGRIPMPWTLRPETACQLPIATRTAETLSGASRLGSGRGTRAPSGRGHPRHEAPPGGRERRGGSSRITPVGHACHVPLVPGVVENDARGTRDPGP